MRFEMLGKVMKISIVKMQIFPLGMAPEDVIFQNNGNKYIGDFISSS